MPSSGEGSGHRCSQPAAHGCAAYAGGSRSGSRHSCTCTAPPPQRPSAPPASTTVPTSTGSTTPRTVSRPPTPSATTVPAAAATTVSVHGATTGSPGGSCRSTPRAIAAGAEELSSRVRVSLGSPCRVTAAPVRAAASRRISPSAPAARNLPLCRASLVTERSTTVSAGASGSIAPAERIASRRRRWRAAGPRPSAARSVASASSNGTARAAWKMRHSDSSGPVADSLSGSSTAWCSPLVTSTAPRSTMSGQSAARSASSSGTTSSNARTAGSTANGSSALWRSTRRAGDGEVRDEPAAHEVAEVDDAVGPHASCVVEPAHNVVVGDVAVDRLQPQSVDDDGEPFRGRGRAVGDEGAPRRVADRGQQRRHDVGGEAQVPLHGALEPGVLEAGQRPGAQRGEPARGRLPPSARGGRAPRPVRRRRRTSIRTGRMSSATSTRCSVRPSRAATGTGARNPASATRVSAAFCASSAARPHERLATLSTCVPSAVRTRKLRSWWLPSSVTSPVSPYSSRASRSASARSRDGRGETSRSRGAITVRSRRCGGRAPPVQRAQRQEVRRRLPRHAPPSPA